MGEEGKKTMSLLDMYQEDDEEDEENPESEKNADLVDPISEAGPSQELHDPSINSTSPKEDAQNEDSGGQRLKTSLKAARRSRLSYPAFGNRRSMRLNNNLSHKRRGSYIGRRLEKIQASKTKEDLGKPRPWTVKEKRALKEALEKCPDSQDYFTLSKFVVTRTQDEVREFILGRERHLMREKAYYLELFGLEEPTPATPLSQWLAATQIASPSSTMDKALHEVLKVAAFEPSSVREMKADFSLLYNYLANLAAEKELPDLSPLDACVLWDTLTEVYNSPILKENRECLQHLNQLWNRNFSKFSKGGDFDVLKEELEKKMKKLRSETYQAASEKGLVSKNGFPKLPEKQGSSRADNNQGSLDESSESAVAQLIGFSLNDDTSANKEPEDFEELSERCYSNINPFCVPPALMSYSELLKTSTDLDS